MLYGIYALILSPVDVLKDWRISVPDKVYVNKEFNVTSSSEKVRAVTGWSNRSIECKNTSGNYVNYPLSSAPANKKAGPKGTVDFPVQIPDTVPDLPSQCRYTTNICYDINVIRKFCEFAVSNDFTLYKTEPQAQVNTDEGKKKESTLESSSPTQSNITPKQTDTTTQTIVNNNTTTREVTRETVTEPTVRPPVYKQVCDPLINLLGIRIGDINCRQEVDTTAR